MADHTLKSKLGTQIQINSVKEYEHFDVLVGEDGRTAIYIKSRNDYVYLPDTTNTAGWTVTLDDCLYVFNPGASRHEIFVISCDGVIALYTSVSSDNNKEINNKIIWNYEIIKEDSECYYSILKYENNILHIQTEFSGIVRVKSIP